MLAAAANPGLAQEARVQTMVEALAQDAREYAVRYGVAPEEAMLRLSAQEASVAATDLIRAEFRHRLAGISVAHRPDFRIQVLLTGNEAVADRTISAGGIQVPVRFTTGAAATQDQLLAAIRAHQKDIRAMLRRPPGLGIDQRRGELVVTLSSDDADLYGRELLMLDLAARTGVPVQLRFVDRDAALAVEGGSRIEGVSPVDGRRYSCTTGFVVINGSRNGIATAAHCPDAVDYVDPQRGRTPLSFAGQWGWGYHDVQIHIADAPLKPLFYADTKKEVVRPVTTWRNRDSTRAGDVVCHRGESTGYSCAEVELVDFAPPGDLCGGPCEPTWVTVAGPSCRSGDSGAPVFSGTTAFGLLKGGSYRKDGSCNYYYYMSTDMLPDGWRLMTDTGAGAAKPTKIQAR